MLAALTFYLQQAALDRPTLAALDVCRIAVVKSLALSPTYCSMARVFKVQQQHALLIGDAKHQIKHPALHFVERQHAAQQQRPQVRQPLRAEGGPTANTSHSVTGQACGAGKSMSRCLSTAAACRRCAQAGLMPLRSPLTSAINTGTPMWKTLGYGLQGDCLARTCGPDQSMPIGQRG